MVPDPSLTAGELEDLLRSQAETHYGPDRARELASNIEQLAQNLSIISHRRLELLEEPPDTRGIQERGDNQ